MKRISMQRLYGMVGRIDTMKKAEIAKEFITNKCELTNDEWDELMMAISSQVRFLHEIEADKNLKPQFRRYA